MKNPTPISHRVWASMALNRRQYKEAIAQAERAISLDPNDIDSLYTMAYVMMAVGRLEEAGEFIKKGMRVDPHNIAHPLYLLGISYFCMGQFEESVNLIERAMKHNPDLIMNLPILSAAYAHLGNEQRARETLNEYLKRFKMHFSLENVMSLFPFKDPEVCDRLADGLLKAGILGKRYYKFYEKNRLSGEKIRELFFGRTVIGVIGLRGGGSQYKIDRSKDGKATYRASPGWYDTDDSGMSWIEGDMLCNQWQIHGWGAKYCMTVFRNPEYTGEKSDEYLGISDFQIDPFSPVD